MRNIREDIRTYGGQLFRIVSARDVRMGDFIKLKSDGLGDRLVEIADIKRAIDRETGQPRGRTMIGTDGLMYGMYQINLYLKPEE